MSILGWLTRHLEHAREQHKITSTGETVAERKAYHEQGMLSPGERALARSLRAFVEAQRKSASEEASDAAGS